MEVKYEITFRHPEMIPMIIDEEMVKIIMFNISKIDDEFLFAFHEDRNEYLMINRRDILSIQKLH